MNYFIITGCVVCGWAMLRMMGTERSQMLRELEARLRREAKKGLQTTDAEPVLLGSPSGASKPPPAQNTKH